MAKKIEYDNIFKILLNGFKTYIRHFVTLSKIMMFPVFGQLIGICLILFPVCLISQAIPQHFSSISISNNLLLILLGIIAVTIPGFIIFLKAFWEYMVAMVSINSMVGNFIRNGDVKDVMIHAQAVKLKTKEYIALLLIISAIWVIGLALPFVVFILQGSLKLAPIYAGALFTCLELLSIFVLFIVSVYLSLCYQVFAYENHSSIDTLKKSWRLIEGNFWRSLFLGGVLGLVTCVIVPAIFQSIIEKTALLSIIASPFKTYYAGLMGDSVSIGQIAENLYKFQLISSSADLLDSLATSSVLSIIGMIVTAFMLPLGSTCYTMLYFDIVTKRAAKAKK